MEIKLITQLARIMKRAELTELEIEDEKDGLKIHLKRGESDRASSTPIVNVTQGGTPLSAPLAGQGGFGAPAPLPGAAPEESAEPQLPPGAVEITSPMVGTFYSAPSPDSDPFCDVGSKVAVDDVLCIVEAMKNMNEIKAEQSGTIVRVLVDNAEPVQFGQPLFWIQKG